MSALGAAKGRSFYKSQGRRQGNVSSTGEELICCSGLMAGRNFSPHEATSGAKGNFGQFIATAHSGWWDLCVLFTRRHLIDAVPLHSFLRSKDKNSSLFFSSLLCLQILSMEASLCRVCSQVIGSLLVLCRWEFLVYFKLLFS